MVSVEEAVKVAKSLGCKWQDELRLYLIHGILHLVGYDDRTKIKASPYGKSTEDDFK